ncbi:MAG: pyruvate kinase [Euryarchaeota archaeon]|nr:pyruvate kinase [Euryarchaeota archaeon]
MRRTRIVATIGPASCDEDSLRTMIQAGLDVARLNYSHGDDEWRAEVAERIRRIANEHGIHIGIMADLPGPKLRLGRFEGTYQLSQGEIVSLRCGETEGYADSSSLPVEYEGLAQEIRPGDPVLLSDGLIQLEVEECNENIVKCRIIEGGPITQRKGINVPGTIVKLPAVGPRDEEALRHAIGLDVEFIAVSYVRSEEDVSPARRILEECNSKAWIVSKIEHPSALESLDGIIEVSDAVMVARGDLGVEIPPEEVPMAQDRIVKAARKRGLPVIVATQMLESMVTNPRPTRAEVADIANAIRHGATAVMLSAETASGAHPVDSLLTMLRVTRRADSEWDGLTKPTDAKFLLTRAVANAGVTLAETSSADRILVATKHGNAARLVAAHSTKIPITAVTNNPSVARKVMLLPGVDAVVCEELERGSSTMRLAIETIFQNGRLKENDRVVAISGSPKAMSGATSTARLYRVTEDGSVDGDE